MAIYVFVGGNQLVEIRAQPLTDLEIRANNNMIKTGKEFVSINKMLGESKSEELKKKLALVYDEYITTEFAKMGYKLEKKC